MPARRECPRCSHSMTAEEHGSATSVMALCPNCGVVRLCAFRAVYPKVTQAQAAGVEWKAENGMVEMSLGCPVVYDPGPQPAMAAQVAPADAMSFALDALLAIRRWPGDCVDHPASVGSPNPHEIAADALARLSALLPR